MSCLDCFTMVSSRKLSGWQLVPSPCRLEKGSTLGTLGGPQGRLALSFVVLLELCLCWPLCLWEVQGGRSLAQNTKGELGDLLVEGWH